MLVFILRRELSMAKSTKIRKPRARVTMDRAKPIRQQFQALLKEHIKSKADKKALAEFLGQSLASIDLMLYRGGGGLDSWISAFIFCFGIDADTVKSFLKDFKLVFKGRKATLSNDLWDELDKIMSEEEKVNWISLVKASAELNLHLNTKKSK